MLQLAYGVVSECCRLSYLPLKTLLGFLSVCPGASSEFRFFRRLIATNATKPETGVVKTKNMIVFAQNMSIFPLLVD